MKNIITLFKQYLKENNLTLIKSNNLYKIVSKENNNEEEFLDIDYKDLKIINFNRNNFILINFLIFLIKNNAKESEIKRLVIGQSGGRVFSNWWYVRDMLYYPIGKPAIEVKNNLQKEGIRIDPIISFIKGKINNVVLSNLLLLVEDDVEGGKAILKMVENNKDLLTKNQLIFINEKLKKTNNDEISIEMNKYVNNEIVTEKFLKEVILNYRYIEINYSTLIKKYILNKNNVADLTTYEKMLNSLIVFIKKKELNTNIENILLLNEVSKKNKFLILIEAKELNLEKIEKIINLYLNFYVEEFNNAELNFGKINGIMRSMSYCLKKNIKEKEKNLKEYIILKLETEEKKSEKNKKVTKI